MLVVRFCVVAERVSLCIPMCVLSVALPGLTQSEKLPSVFGHLPGFLSFGAWRADVGILIDRTLGNLRRVDELDKVALDVPVFGVMEWHAAETGDGLRYRENHAPLAVLRRA